MSAYVCGLKERDDPRAANDTALLEVRQQGVAKPCLSTSLFDRSPGVDIKRGCIVVWVVATTRGVTLGCEVGELSDAGDCQFAGSWDHLMA